MYRHEEGRYDNRGTQEETGHSSTLQAWRAGDLPNVWLIGWLFLCEWNCLVGAKKKATGFSELLNKNYCIVIVVLNLQVWSLAIMAFDPLARVKTGIHVGTHVAEFQIYLFSYGLLKSVAYGSRCMEFNGGMLYQWWITRNWEGRGPTGLILCAILVFASSDWGISRRTSLRIVSWPRLVPGTLQIVSEALSKV